MEVKMLMMTWGEYIDSLCDDETYRNYREAKRKILDKNYTQEQEEVLKETLSEKLEGIIDGMMFILLMKTKSRDISK